MVRGNRPQAQRAGVSHSALQTVASCPHSIPVAWQVQATHLHLGERTVLYARNLSHIWDWWGWHQGGNGVREKAFLLSRGLGRPWAVPVSLS